MNQPACKLRYLLLTAAALIFACLLAACTVGSATLLPATAVPTATPLPTLTATRLPSPTDTLTPAPTVRPPVPDFTHIIVIVFENHEFDSVVRNREMPNFNQYIQGNTLLTQYYAIMHPSLPNYLAIFGGDTFGVTTDCEKCFVSAPNLADQIEASGRTWKAYFQDMPRPCFVGDTAIYVQKHDPFMYFDSIRLDAARCDRSVVPLGQLDSDLAAGALPNFLYIMPNSCVSTDDDFSDPACTLSLADGWLGGVMDKLLAYLNPRAANEPYLIVLTWDEGQGSHSCCGLPPQAGGRIATVLISPLAKSGFQDATPYTHYSLLKTIESAWGLPFLGHAADDDNVLMTAPWK
ncbi:MAG: alkaline phosphatase family protein [Anaerolineales bacterium]